MLTATIVANLWFCALAGCGAGGDDGGLVAETADAEIVADLGQVSGSAMLPLAVAAVDSSTVAGAKSGATADQTSRGSRAASNVGSRGLSSAAALVPVVRGGYRSTSADALRLYGPGVHVMDGLWNIDAKRVDGNDTLPAIRFRAPYSGPVSSIRLYWSDGRGYAGGNGGDIAIKLLPDDGSARHLPDWSATPLATGRRVPGSMSMSNGTYSKTADRFAPDTLSGKGQLEAGKLYHLVGINNASNPAVDWSSWDMAFSIIANGQAARWFDPYDFAALYGSRAAGRNAAPTWQDWTVDGHAGAYVVPILQLTMADGRSFGNSNMETGNVDSSSRVWKSASGHPIRERFTPTQARTFSGLSIQTAKSRGSGGLGWQILRGSTVLAAGTIEQASVNYRVDTSVSSTGVLTWYDTALTSTVRFEPNETYDIVFTPQGTSEWVFADQRNGSAYGFSSPAAFSESQAQHYYAGRWINANHWSKLLSASGSNWRVVLHQVP